MNFMYNFNIIKKWIKVIMFLYNGEGNLIKNIVVNLVF